MVMKDNVCKRQTPDQDFKLDQFILMHDSWTMVHAYSNGLQIKLLHDWRVL